MIRRSIESVLGQTYTNIEFVIQDGASTDGTVEIIRSYNDERIKLVSEPDSGIGEAHWKVLNRCRGDIIGTCLSDDELLPGAVETAVARMRAEPHLGAVTGDSYLCDFNGNVTGMHIGSEFDLVKYLFGPYCPYFPATFFRRQALLDVGLHSSEWEIHALEYEIWFRVGTQHEIKYFPGFASKFAVHDQQDSRNVGGADVTLEGWLRLIDKWFSKEGFFGEDSIRKNACLYNRLYTVYNHFRAYKIAAQTEKLYHRIRNFNNDIVESYSQSDLLRSKALFEYLKYPQGDGPVEITQVSPPLSEEEQSARKSWSVLVAITPGFIKRALPVSVKTRIGNAFINLASDRSVAAPEPAPVAEPAKALELDTDPINGLQPLTFSEALYDDVARLYYARGQISRALQMWRCAEDLNDPTIDGLACQAMLLSPDATYESLLHIHTRWASRHAVPKRIAGGCAVRPFTEDRKINIGYHCAFMDSDTIRFIMSDVIKMHDRNRFAVYGYYGYTPPVLISDVKDAFDVVRAVDSLSDEQFVEQVRSDGIDILVEMTGFSPLNRFAAMASRCAPIQISYLNHTSTSSVPNIDYIFADAISVLPEEDRFFTEKVWRLPGCFLGYHYDTVALPPLVDAPSRKKGFITFGYFGSGGKLNDELITIWARIMNRVPDSQLYMRNHQLSTQDNRQFMIDRFRGRGIGVDRLRISGGADRETIVRCYDDVDISLDTWPYCGGNTVAESLWQGVPVITLKGDRFSGRYGASLLTAAGCTELIADTVDEYIDIAVTLSNSPDRLEYYRGNLRRMARKFGLSDAKRFAAKLEDAYLSMMRSRR